SCHGGEGGSGAGGGSGSGQLKVQNLQCDTAKQGGVLAAPSAAHETRQGAALLAVPVRHRVQAPHEISHAANHSGSRPYKCPNCDYVCINRSMLNSHLRSHSANRAHRCHDCGFTTKFVHNLHLHTRRFGHRGGDCDGSADGNKTAGRRRRLPERSTRSSAGAASSGCSSSFHGDASGCSCRRCRDRFDATAANQSLFVQHPPPPPRPPPPPPLPPPLQPPSLPLKRATLPRQQRVAAHPSGRWSAVTAAFVFRNFVLCVMHLGYHSTGANPFRCNGCGFQAYSELGFNMH
uniref:C2H2-type domain-containing protein n=1 Tax=Macrostomum lignano TaxID=282301 RepID=A0A1I8JS17_9PLAT